MQKAATLVDVQVAICQAWDYELIILVYGINIQL